MRRLIYEELKRWEECNTKEPLLVTGARQVGKTWIIQEFCKDTYADYVYINLESQSDLISIFEQSLDPGDIIRSLEIYLNREIDPARCAIVIDEIQQCERAITSLKYFCEAQENYRVIGAGSLLGVKINRFASSFPVGKVKILQMFPMGFDEFLDACGQERLRAAILNSFRTMKPLPDAIHEKAMGCYRDYLYIGGMPRAVMDYIAHDCSVTRFDRSIHRDILTAYTADMTKYTSGPAEGVKITQLYESVPRQLAKENPKFMYSDIRQYANKRDFSSSLDWLLAAGLVLKCDQVSLPQTPLHAYTQQSMFKIYLSDVGLLSTSVSFPYSALLPESNNIFKGAVTENYVLESLSIGGRKGYYYKPSQSLEIDFLLDLDGEIIPVEVKSGRHKRSTSLKRYLEMHHPTKALRISEHNFGVDGELYSVPLYAVFCLRLKR